MNKLRKRMIGSLFFISLFVFLLMSALITTALLVYNARQADWLTQAISQNNGTVPLFQRHTVETFSTQGNEASAELEITTSSEASISFVGGRTYLSVIDGNYGFNEETAFRTRYFVVYMDGNLVKEIDIEHIASIDSEEAADMARQALEKSRKVGYIEEFRYRVVEDEDSQYVIFLDCSENSLLFHTVGELTLLVSVFFTLLITVIFAIMSKRVVEPFEENSKRQKQFITDASHELKTPLAIISANAEVLEYKNGKNDWTKNIIDQTKEMSKLINQLLILSKVEEVEDDFVLEEIELSSLVTEKAESFREVAEQKNASLTLEMPQELKLAGNREQLTQLVSILTENATKYVRDSGEIRITLKKSGRYAVLEVYNTAEIDPKKDYNRLFDRFYRTDKSRSSQTGGHGIGLSIAKKIVDRHNGRISASARGDGICFKAEISASLKLSTSQKRQKRRVKSL